MKKFLISLSLVIFLSSATITLAQNNNSANSQSDSIPPQAEMNGKNQKPLLNQVSAMREENKETKMIARDDMKDKVQAARTENKTNMITKAEMKDKVQEARAEYKTKIAEIKDTKKQEIITNLDSKISQINTKRTEEMNARLTRLNMMLDKFSTQESNLKSEGKNTTAIAYNITIAQKAINEAKTAVDTQINKEYTVNITTESALKNATSVTIRQFMTDLKSVKSKVVLAQQAVAKVKKDIEKLNEASPTPTAQIDTITP